LMMPSTGGGNNNALAEVGMTHALAGPESPGGAG